MNTQNSQPVFKKKAFKKIAITGVFLVAIFISFTLISIVSLFFYIQSDHVSQLLQSQINRKIPGRMEWANFNLSLFAGELTLENYRLSLKAHELVSLDRIHIALDLSGVMKPFDFSTMLNNFDISKMINHELVIKNLTIENPHVSLSMTPEQRLNIVSAFTASEEEAGLEDKNKPFHMPFNLVINQLNLKQGKFEYKSDSDKIALLIDDINFQGSGNFIDKDKSDMSFKLSMKSFGSDLTIDGNMKNIFQEAEPMVDLTADAKLVTSELLNMLGLAGTGQQNISGNLSIHATLAGSLNDPSFACRINSPDGQIMGREIKKAAIDVLMEKREITIKKFEFQHLLQSGHPLVKSENHSDATLKADGSISLAKTFPEGFLDKRGNGKLEQKIKTKEITANLHIRGDNIDAGKLLESENIKGVKGLCSFKADLSGSLDNPEIKLALKAQNAGYQESPLVDSGDVDLMLSNGVLTIKKFDITSCDSSVNLDGTIKLLERQTDGYFTLVADPLFNLFAKSGKINLAQYLHCLNVLDDQAVKEQKIMAIFTANAQLTGTVKNPRVALSISGQNIELVGQKIGAVTLKAGYQNKKALIDSLIVTLDLENSIAAKGWIDENRKFKADILSKGVDLTLIESIKQYSAITGVASGYILAEGSLDSLKSSKVSGNIALKHVKIIDKPFQDFSVNLNLKENLLNLNGRLNFDVGANFDFKSKNFALQGIFNKTELLPWFTFAGVKGIESGTATGRVDIKGNADNLDKISGSCALSEISLNLFNDPAIFADNPEAERSDNSESILVKKKMLVKASGINAWIDGKEFRVEKFKTLLPENGEVVLAGSGNMGGNIRAEADATLPVRFASLFLPDMAEIKGAVKLNLRANLQTGKDAQPADRIKSSSLYAKLELVDIGVTLPIASSSDDSHSNGSDKIKLHSINGIITADMNRVEIPQITGRVRDGKTKRSSGNSDGGGGSNKALQSGEFRLSGGAGLKDFMPHDIHAKLAASAIPVNMVEDLTANFDTELNFKGDPKSSALLSGNILINHAQWTGDINVEKKILSTLTDRLIEQKRTRKENSQKTNNRQANNTTYNSNSSDNSSSTHIVKMFENMQLNIAVKGRKPFILDNNLAYMEIHPDIRIRGSAQSPLISGRSEINPGTINYQSTEFELTRGIIDFVNPYKIEPELDIESHRKVRDWDIILSLSGHPDNINFKLTSEPRLEDGDIISLLLRGKTVTELIDAEGGTTLSAAGMLSQVAASAVSDRVKSATGLDIFEVGFGNTKDKSSSSITKYSNKTNSTVNKKDDNGFNDINVTVGKEITDRITVKYGSENKDGIMVGKTSAKYKVTDSVSVSGFQDSEGQFGGEVRYRLEFR